MAHADGWIRAYELLEAGRDLPADLRERVMSNRSGIGETMLHWYAIEGDADVVEKIIRLGFDVNTVNSFHRTPLFECATIDRWEIVALLLAHGARTDVKDRNDQDVFEALEDQDTHDKGERLRKLVAESCSLQDDGAVSEGEARRGMAS